MSLIEIHVVKEYYDVVPRPLKTEYESLKESIKEDGQQIPIVVNEQGVVLDGHTRFDICKELGIEPIYETKKFETKKDEKNFVIISNLARRHLNLSQRAFLLFDWWKMEKARSKKIGGKKMWKNRKKGITGIQSKSNGRLAKQLGKMLGCSAHMAWEMMKIFEKADEKTKQKVLDGSMTVGQAITTIYKKPLSIKIAYPHLAEKHKRLRWSYCLSCGGDTKVVDKKECHVHDRLCCTKCGWGI